MLDLIDDPDMGGKLGDLRVLTVGFLELSARAPRTASASGRAEADLTRTDHRAARGDGSGGPPASRRGPSPGRSTPPRMRQSVPRSSCGRRSRACPRT